MKRRRLLTLLALMGLAAADPALAQQAAAPRKPVVAVTAFKDQGRSGQAEALRTMIQTAVTETGKFRIIERDFEQLDAEQELARAGRVTTNRPGRSGGYEGVDYIIYGTITAASGGRQSDIAANAGIGMIRAMTGLSIPAGDCNRMATSLAVDIKIVNAVTGEIAFAQQVTRRAESAVSCGGDANLDLPAVMRDIANQIAAKLTLTMYPVKVAGVQPDGIFVLTYGEGVLRVGDVLGVYMDGPGIVDPDTKVVLTRSSSEIGRIRVREVQTRFSMAEPLTAFAAPPPPGSVVRLLPPEPPRSGRGRGR